MKIRYTSNVAAGVALVALLVVASPLPAFARQAQGESNTSVSQSTQAAYVTLASTDGETTRDSSTSVSPTGSHVMHPDNMTMSMSESDVESSDALHSRAAKLLSDARQNKQSRSETQRQEACKQHEAAIDQRFQVLGDKGSRYLNGFNNIFTKVQAYQTKNQLNVPNYDMLVADVTAKQAAATTAVNALDALSGAKIDCTASDPAQSVASVKAAVQDSRSALQAYRSALKTLVQALLDAKKAVNTSSTNSTADTATQGSK